MNQQTTVTTNDNENNSKPLTGSWRAKIHRDKGFQMLVEEILQQIPTQGKEFDARIRARVLENCETIWKLGAVDNCGKSNGKAIVEPKKKIENEPVLTLEPTAVSINSSGYNSKPITEERKNKSKKTTKKSCVC